MTDQDNRRTIQAHIGDVKGVLYVVSTPIGNLEDLSRRAIDQLTLADVIVCEDKRHSITLLKHYSIKKPLLSYHDHSSEYDRQAILSRLAQGQRVALISDAGTPTIADPGYKLIQIVLEAGYEVLPVPGMSACIVALSVSGLPSDRFSFEGFLPAKSEARLKRLQRLSEADRTLIFYESPHRIVDCLGDLLSAFGETRKLCMARELTKSFETFLRGSVADVLEQVKSDVNQRKGEIVLVVDGCRRAEQMDTSLSQAQTMLPVLLEELPLKQASSLAAKLTGAKKNAVYQYALSLKS